MAVESAAILANLHEPRPNPVWRGVDGNRVSGFRRINRKEIISGQCGVEFAVGRAPAHAPVAQAEVIDKGRTNEDHQQSESKTFEPLLHVGTSL